MGELIVGVVFLIGISILQEAAREGIIGGIFALLFALFIFLGFSWCVGSALILAWRALLG